MSLAKEHSTYEKLYPSFGGDKALQWVVISGDTLLDFFDRFETAALVALQTFGNAPFLIKQVDAPAASLPFVVLDPE